MNITINQNLDNVITENRKIPRNQAIPNIVALNMIVVMSVTQGFTKPTVSGQLGIIESVETNISTANYSEKYSLFPTGEDVFVAVDEEGITMLQPKVTVREHETLKKHYDQRLDDLEKVIADLPKRIKNELLWNLIAIGLLGVASILGGVWLIIDKLIK